MPLERVTDGLFDFAGMFPPASLSFDDALRQSAEFTTSLHDHELVGNDIVLTQENLAKLNKDALQKVGFAKPTCHVCLVGVAVDDAPEVAAAIKAFNKERSSQRPAQKITSLELHFEEQSIALIQDSVVAARKILGRHVRIYLEPKWDDARLAKGLEGVMLILDSLNQDSPRVGFKVRCEGPTALSHRTLALVMAHVNRREIPLKLTQGLHHAFAGDDRFGNQHGFLNCVFGLRLHRDTDMDLEELEACLADDAPEDFVWDEGIGWRGHRISMQSMVESSVSTPIAIGSCSIAEPDAELQELQGR